MITADQIHALAPTARNNYVAAFAHANEAMGPFGINTPLRVAHFMAQVLHETAGLTITCECMNYTHADRIQNVFPHEFITVSDAIPFIGRAFDLANRAYGGRMGNCQPGDGWVFRGRGLLQLTGRECYERFGKHLGIKLADDPDLATDPKWSLKIAAAEWEFSRCNDAADADDLNLVTRRVNGALEGLAERAAWLKKTRAIWCV